MLIEKILLHIDFVSVNNKSTLQNDVSLKMHCDVNMTASTKNCNLICMEMSNSIHKMDIY